MVKFILGYPYKLEFQEASIGILSLPTKKVSYYNLEGQGVSFVIPWRLPLPENSGMQK